MRINVSTVHRHIQISSQRGPIKTDDVAKALGAFSPKQRRKLDRIVEHLADHNMICCTGNTVVTKNILPTQAA